MADTRVDILLALRTQLQGNPEALAYLDRLEQQGTRTARNVGSEWDQLMRKLSQKFSLPQVGMDLLRGFGIGSAFALIQNYYRGVEESARAAAQEAQNFQDRLSRLAEGAARLAEGRVADWIEGLAPAERIEAKKRELASLTEAIAEQQRRLAESRDAIAAASTDWGKFLTWLRGSPTGWKFLGTEGAQAESKKWADEQVAVQLAATERIQALEQQVAELRRGLRKDETAETEKAAKEEEQLREDLNRSAIAEAQAREAEQERAAEAAQRMLDARQKEADAIRAATADENRYAQEVTRINALRGVAHGLTEAEADAAIARLDAERRISAEKENSRRLSDRIAEIDQAVALIANDNLRTQTEKNAAILPLLEEQNRLIAARLELLEREATLTGDDQLRVALEEEIARLRKQLAENKGSAANIRTPETLALRDQKSLRDFADPSQHYQSAGEGVVGSMIQQMTAIGTLGDQLARSLSQVGESIRTSLGGAFADVLLTGGSTTEKLIGLWNGVVTSFVQSGAQMLADWVVKHTLMGTIKKVFVAQDVATTVAGEAAKTGATALGTGARILLAIKEAGAWLVQSGIKAMSAVASIPYVGPILAVAALAAVIAAGAAVMKGFAVGGYTERGGREEPAGVVHKGEWVAPKWMVEDPRYAHVIASLEAARMGVPGYGWGGFVDFLKFGGLPKWALDSKLRRFAEDYNVIDGRKLWMAPASSPSGASAAETSGSDGFSFETYSPAQAITRPAYEPPASARGSAAAGGAGAGQDITIVDARDPVDLERLLRDPRMEQRIVYVMNKHRSRFGRRT